jgi:hypothetical protein
MELMPDLTRVVDPDAIEVPADATPLQFLEAIYRSAPQPMHRRLKAACEALPFVHPKLAVSAQINGGDFARTLELAMRRSAKVLEPPKAVEHQSPLAFRRL